MMTAWFLEITGQYLCYVHYKKILEKVMYDRVNDFLNEFDINFKYQFGFR